MERELIDSKGIVLIGLDSKICKECIIKNAIKKGYAHILCPLDNIKCRLGYVKGDHGECYAKSKDSKTTANFKSELISSYQSIPQITKLFDKVRSNVASLETRRVNLVVHNLKNLHAQSIQELTAFVPQDKFTYNVGATLDTVKKNVKKDIEGAALTFLRLVKINNGIKAELSIYDKLIMTEGVGPVLSRQSYNIMDVVFLVAQPFFEDFHRKRVFFKLEEFHKRAYFDFETIFSALYHIIGNATKYVEYGTEVNVAFAEDDNYCTIRFIMSSYHLYPEDLQHLYENGYSGKLATEYGEAGHGLGMYRAKLFVGWNKGDLTIEAGNDTREVKGRLYSNNVVIIKLPKNQG